MREAERARNLGGKETWSARSERSSSYSGIFECSAMYVFTKEYYSCTVSAKF